MNVVFDLVAAEDQVVAELIPKVTASLMKEAKPFCLWLRGDLGAGKTTFAGKLLHGLGLNTRIPVLSPTFTYLTEYKLPFGIVAHLDLYRMPRDDHESITMLLADRTFAGMIVEWPERCPESDEIAPTGILDISFASDNSRRYIFVDRTKLRD